MLTDIENFIQQIRRRNPQARTWRNYACDLRLFVSVTGDCTPSEVTFRTLDQFVNLQVDQNCMATTINRRLAAVVSLYKFLAQNDEKLTCPVSAHRHRLREPQRLAHPLSEETIQRFFAAIETPRELAMFTILRDCGLRISELAQLKITDLNLQAIQPRLIAHGKGSRERTLYVSDSAVQAITAYLAIRPVCANDFVFLSYQNEGMSSGAVHDCLVRCRERAGVSLTAHAFRHHFATVLHARGMPVTSIQALLGHRWLQTTQGYLLVSDEQVQADYETASRKIEGWTTTIGDKKTTYRKPANGSQRTIKKNNLIMLTGLR